MPPQHFHVRDFTKRLCDLCNPARRQHKRIATRQDDFPDFRVIANVGERALNIVRRHGLAQLRPHHVSAEAKAAIDRAHARDFQQHAIFVAMHDSRNGAVRMIADGIGKFSGMRLEFARIRHKLPCDGVMRIAVIDERGHRLRDGNGIAFADARSVVARHGWHKPRCDEIIGRAERAPEGIPLPLVGRGYRWGESRKEWWGQSEFSLTRIPPLPASPTRGEEKCAIFAGGTHLGGQTSVS